MAFDPRKYAMTDDGAVFDPVAYTADFKDAAPGKLESIIRGGAQGVASDFADEITGMGEAGIEKLRGNPEELMNLYRKYRDESRKKYDSAAEENPWSYGGGFLVGTAAQLPILGMAGKVVAPAAKAVALASESPVIATGVQGAIQGFGRSDDMVDNPKGAAFDTALGGGLGAATQGIANLAGPAIKAGLEKIRPSDELASKVISYILGPREEAVLARIKNPAAIRNAKQPIQIADRVAAAVEKIKAEAGELSEKAVNELSDLYTGAGTKSKRSIVSYLSRVQNELKAGGKSGSAVGDANVKAVDVIEKIKGRIKGINEGGLNDRVTEKTIGQIVRELQDSADWDDATSGVMNKALMRVSGFMNRNLKKANPPYAKAMEPVAERASLIDPITSALGFKRGPRGALVPSDQTASRVMAAFDENKKSATNALLSKLDKIAKTKILRDIENSKLAEEFVGGKMHGSRNALSFGAAGAAAGAAVGGPGGAAAGGAAGGAIGRYIDTHGKEIAGDIIDKYVVGKKAVKAAFEVLPEVVRDAPSLLGQYAGPLQWAASRGAPALAVTDYLLQKSDPKYRATVYGEDE